MNPWTCTVNDHHSVLDHEIPLWETWFCSSLGVPIPVLLVNPPQCPCRQFSVDPYCDHIQTCQCQSVALPTHEWIVYSLSLLFRSVGHRVKTHKVTPTMNTVTLSVYLVAFVVCTRKFICQHVLFCSYISTCDITKSSWETNELQHHESLLT